MHIEYQKNINLNLIYLLKWDILNCVRRSFMSLTTSTAYRIGTRGSNNLIIFLTSIEYWKFKED